MTSCILQQDAENLREPHQKEEVLNSNPPDDEVPGEQQQEEETPVDANPPEGEQVNQEDERARAAPVHQGQPEI